jgi:hypothetical protein
MAFRDNFLIDTHLSYHVYSVPFQIQLNQLYGLVGPAIQRDIISYILIGGVSYQRHRPEHTLHY